jgi:hypothetical protein
VGNLVQNNLLDVVLAVGHTEMAGQADAVALVVALAKTRLGVIESKTPLVQVVFQKQSCCSLFNPRSVWHDEEPNQCAAFLCGFSTAWGRISVTGSWVDKSLSNRIH